MKTSIRFSILLGVFFLLHNAVFAGIGTAPQVGLGGIIVFAGDVFVSPKNPHNGVIGYNVYRRSSGEEWKKITSVPLQFPDDFDDFEKSFGREKLDSWAKFHKISSSKKIWEILRQRHKPDTLQAMFLQARTFVLTGLVFVDTTAQTGKEYEYAVTTLSGSGESEKSVRGKASLAKRPVLGGISAPKKVQYDSTKLLLGWKFPKNDTTFGFKVYRAEGNEEMRLLGNVLNSHDDSGKVLKQYEYWDKTVRRGRIYRYAVVPTDFWENVGRSSDTVAILADNLKSLPIAQNLHARTTTAGIELRWNMTQSGTSLLGFVVYRATDSIAENFTPIDTISHTVLRYTDKTPKPMGKYYYRLRTIAIDGTLGGFSSSSGDIFQVPFPPTAPQFLTASSEKQGVVLRWQRPTNVPLAGFYVFRGTSTYDTLRQISPLVKDTTFTDTATHALSPYGTYFYAVSAVNASFVEGKKSEKVFVKIKGIVKLDTPLAVRVYPSGKSAMIEWENSAVRFPFLAGYNLYKIAGNTKKKLNDTLLNTRIILWKDTSIADDESVGYALTHVDMLGNESPLSPPTPLTVPQKTIQPPAKVRCLPSNDGIRVEWSQSADSRIKSYEVWREIQDGKAELLATVSAENSSYVDQKTVVGTYYFYKIIAVSTKGKSKPSREVTVKR